MALIVLAAVQIVARLVFHAGWPWLDPLSRVLVVWTALFGALAAVREDRHISLDVASFLLHGALRRHARTLTLLLAAGVSAALAWYGWRLVELDRESGGMVFGNVPAWQAELARVADRWDDYASRPSCAHRALAYKAVFKVLYY